jgi:hypothetical protein
VVKLCLAFFTIIKTRCSVTGDGYYKVRVHSPDRMVTGIRDDNITVRTNENT